MTEPNTDIAYSAHEIHDRIEDLALEIAEDCRIRGLTRIMMIGVLDGAFVFLADLSRAVRRAGITVDIALMKASSYRDGAKESSRDVRIELDVTHSPEDRDVILVEDIADTRYTLKKLLSNVWEHQPESVRVCALLDRIVSKEVDAPVDFVGFTVEHMRFFVGFGMDNGGCDMRDLDHIRMLPEATP